MSSLRPATHDASPSPPTRTTDGAGSAARARYLERLSVPWWMWLITLGLASVLAAEIGLGAGGLRTWLPFALLLPALAGGMWWLGNIKISVVGEELLVDDARLPLNVIADAIPLTVDDRRLLLGAGADPLGFVIQRPWISGGVQIVLNDPADPTPYWFISTRHPTRLAATLTRAKQRAGELP